MHTFARSLRFLSNYFVEISLLMCSFFISRIKIASRPIRTWFQSSSAKEAAAAASKKQADEGGVWGALEGQKVQKRHKKQQVSRGATPEERLKAIRKSERNGAGAGGGAVERDVVQAEVGGGGGGGGKGLELLVKETKGTPLDERGK